MNRQLSIILVTVQKWYQQVWDTNKNPTCSSVVIRMLILGIGISYLCIIYLKNIFTIIVLPKMHEKWLLIKPKETKDHCWSGRTKQALPTISGSQYLSHHSLIVCASWHKHLIITLLVSHSLFLGKGKCSQSNYFLSDLHFHFKIYFWNSKIHKVKILNWKKI